MPLNANQTIVVRNLFSKPEDDLEIEISTTLVGCSVHNRTVASATSDFLVNASSWAAAAIDSGCARR